MLGYDDSNKMLYQYAHVFSLATMLSRRPFIIALSDTVKREIKELSFLHIRASKFKRSLSTYIRLALHLMYKV